jgi:hypothetical protein
MMAAKAPSEPLVVSEPSELSESVAAAGFAEAPCQLALPLTVTLAVLNELPAN